MIVFLYNILLKLYKVFIILASAFKEKARLWIKGRKGIFNKLKEAFSNNTQPVIWMHCASLGEFEQGRPVLEALKKEYPSHKILLTFFSPSGYEVRKNYSGADWIFYLPLDTKSNATAFIETIRPALVIFVKYEYWYNYLNLLHKKQVPVILISAIFRRNSIFFKTYGTLHKRMLNFFNHIFVQDEASKILVSKIIPAEKITVAGDTRFDRVITIANQFESIAPIEKFIQNREVIVAGSTWPDDEKNLQKLFDLNKIKYSLIIAPHEINSDHLKFLNTLFPTSILYSELKNNPAKYTAAPGKAVLIIDNIGMLSKLYHYSTISYIGGGFNKSGIHNTLEAAVYGKPVVFGPNYQKFAEAISLVKIKGAYSYKHDNELIDIVDIIQNNSTERIEAGIRAGDFVQSNKGATEVILHYLRKISF